MDPDPAPLTAYDSLAKLIDHALLEPDLHEDRVREGCDLAARYGVAAVFVRPTDVDLAVRQLRGSGVTVGSVIGFPHGGSHTAAKLYEARDLIRRGAKELEMPINVGKLVSRQFPFLETEAVQMANACRAEGVLLKMIFENAYLTEDLKLIACKLAKRAEVDFVSTSTGFGPGGYTLADVRLMVQKCNWRVKVKAAGIASLDQALEAYNAGAGRVGTTATAAILDEWKKRLAQQPSQPAAPEVSAAT